MVVSLLGMLVFKVVVTKFLTSSAAQSLIMFAGTAIIWQNKHYFQQDSIQ
jgi:hypothetical protein